MFRTAFVLSILLALSRPALAGGARVAIDDGWSLRHGDSPAGADGVPAWIANPSDDGWTPTSTLQFGASGPMFLWLRAKVPAGTWRDPALLVEGLQNAAEIWLDGEKVRTLGQLVPDGEARVPGYGVIFVPLPADAGGRTLYLRIQASRGNVGMQKRPVVGEYTELLQQTWSAGYGQALVGAVMFVLGILALGLFLQRRRETALGHFAAFSLGMGSLLLSLSQHLGLLGVSTRFILAFLYVGAAIFAPALLAFVRASFRGATWPWTRWAERVLWAVAAFIAIVPAVSLERAGWVLNPLLFTVTGGVGVATLVAAKFALAGDRDGRLVLGGLAALFLVTVHDVLSAMRFTKELTIYMHWGVLALTAAMLLLVVRRFTALAHETEARAAALEAQRAEALAANERMQQSAAELAAAVSRLSSATRDQNGALERQASTIEETRVTAEEIRQTSLLASERATGLLGKAAEADEAGKRGESSLHESVAEVEQIGQEVAEMARRVTGLQARTREIATIVDTVKGLADQSNMLALNAAIEAVRSGEHGKGFGVVAREIRALADQSIQATARIRQILGGLEDGIREATALSGRGEERVQRSVAQVRATADELRRVSELSRETSGAVRQISAAVSQQNAGITQIFTAVNDLAEQMRGTVARLQETESAIVAVDKVGSALGTTEKAA